MSRLPQPPAEIALASFEVLEGSGASGARTDVQFNPASLEYTLANEFDDSGGNNATRQFVKKTSAKLALTLVYDSTDTGEDVRSKTEQISRLLEPAKSGKKSFAPKVKFAWGSYTFQGVIEQYKETIDFFSASGVPLRASIALTLASQNVEFQSAKNPAASVDGQGAPEPLQLPGSIAPSQAALAAGDPRAARSIASASGSASLRFGADAGLSVGAGVQLAGAASFASGGGPGAATGAAVALDLRATAGAAFAGLRAPAPGAPIDSAAARSALLPRATVSATDFAATGRARVQNGSSLSARVGADADLHAQLRFE